MKKIKIGVDLDGVVADYYSKVVDYVNARNPLANYTVTDIKEYRLSDLKITQPQIDDMVEFHGRIGLFGELEPINGAIEGLEELTAQGHSLHIITSRRRNSRTQTVEWLENYNVDYMSISFTENKGMVGHTLGINTMIDDHYGFLKQTRDVGIMGLLYDQSWNRNFNGKQSIQRVHNWEEIVELFKQ